MKEEKNILDVHCFICERCSYENEDGPSKPNTALNFRNSVKDKAKSIWDNPKIRVNSSGCLGQCNSGICAVIYPSGRWLTELRPGDESIVLSEIHKEVLDEPTNRGK